MAREIKTTLALDGEAAFKRAIKEASQSITQMGSALTLATAQFKADGDAMKLMESRSKTLRKEIDQQREIVKALQGALADVTKKYGENSKEAEKWQADLNRAQARLVNLEQELSNNEKGLDKNGRAFASAGDKAQKFGGDLSALDRIQKNTTFQALDTALGNIESGFKRAQDRAVNFAKAVWGNAADASNWADEIATTSTQLGISAQTLQGWIISAKLVDTEVGDITKAMTRLVNPTEQVQNALKDLGVSTRRGIDWDAITPGPDAAKNAHAVIEAGMQMRPTLEIFWDAVESLGQMKDATRQEAAANAIFGRSYREMLPLIQAGRDSWDGYIRDAEKNGQILDETMVGNLTSFNDSLQNLNSQFDAFQRTIGADIAPGLQTISDALAKLLSELTLWAGSNEGQEALGKLSGAIAGVVESFTSDANFTALVEGATGAIQGFTGAMTWVVEHGEQAAVILGTIKIAFAGMSIAKSVLSGLTLMKEIKWLDMQQGAAGLSGALGAAGGEGAAGGSAAAAGGAAAAGTAPGWFNALGIGALAKTAFESAVKTGQGLVGALFGEKKTIETLEPVTTGGPKRQRNITGTASEASMQGAVENIYDELYKVINDYDPAETGALSTVDFWKNVLSPMVESAANLSGVPRESVEPIKTVFMDAFARSFEDDWEGTTGGLLNILQEAIEDAQQAGAEDAQAAGESISQGVADGIDAGIPAAVEAIGRLTASVLSALDGTIAAAGSRMAAIAGGTFAGGRTAAPRSASYTATSNLYIQQMNMNNGTDAQGLAAAMAAENRRIRAGFGG